LCNDLAESSAFGYHFRHQLKGVLNEKSEMCRNNLKNIAENLTKTMNLLSNNKTKMMFAKLSKHKLNTWRIRAEAPSFGSTLLVLPDNEISSWPHRFAISTNNFQLSVGWTFQNASLDLNHILMKFPENFQCTAKELLLRELYKSGVLWRINVWWWKVSAIAEKIKKTRAKAHSRHQD
jgi:hypothetical protein